MKLTFAHLKNRAGAVSVRSLALVLCFVMLVTAVGAGTMMTAFAKGRLAEEAYITDAAQKVVDIADSVDIPDDAPLKKLSKKVSDLAETGYGGVKLYYTTNTSGTWSSATNQSMTMSNNNNTATKSLTLAANTTYRFVLVADNNDWWGNNSFNLSSQTSKTNNLAKSSSFSASSNSVTSNPNTLITSSAASYTFTFTISSGTCTVTGGNGGAATVCSTNKTYRVVGTANLCGSAWANTATANNMTYSSTYGCYTKTYSNVAAGTFEFRMIEGSTWSEVWGFDRATKVDDNNLVSLWQVKPDTNDDGDNNIQMTTNAKANIEIRLDDSKTNTSAITVIVTPAVSTVTAGTVTGGTITVDGGSSKANIPYEGTVTLVATPAANYTFSSWVANDKLVYDKQNTATTTAVVKGTTTVTATFTPNSFTVTKANETGYTITKPTAATAQYTTTVTVSATAASDYYIDGLYYKEQGSETIHTIFGSATHTTTSSLSDKTFTMPASNVTIYAWAHEKESNTVTYGVCTDQSAMGYVSVGEYCSATEMKRTIDSNTKVLEGTEVQFSARPAVGYKFVGWYDTDANTGGTLRSSSQDYKVTSPSGNYFARFAGSSFAPEYQKTKLYVVKRTNTKYAHYFSYDNPSGTDTNNNFNYSWPGEEINAVNGWTETSIVYNNTTYNCWYRVLTYKSTSGTNGQTKFLTHNNDGTESGQDLLKQNKVYLVDWDGTTNKGGTTFNDITNSDVATVSYYPIKYYITNPELKSATASDNVAPYFGQANTSVTIKHKPADTSNNKMMVTTTNFKTDNDTDHKTTSTSRNKTMPETYTATPVYTVTFIPKEYFPVTFSAGPNGTVEACTGSSWNSNNKIKSGAMVKEGTNVTFKATANSNYTFAKWTGSYADGTTGTSFTNSTTATTSWQVNTTNKGLIRKGWFKSNNDGTQTTSDCYYFINTGSNFNEWYGGTKVYIKNGHAYGYLNSPSNNTYYYFGLSSEQNPKSKNDDGKGCFYYDSNSDGKEKPNVITDFSSLITEPSDWYQQNTGRLYYGRCKVSSDKVKRLIIDFGEWKDNELKKGYMRIIPVWDDDPTNVDIYAKDGSYRGDSAYDYFPGIADTVLTGASNIGSESEFNIGTANRGDTITVTTTIDKDHKGDFYIRGFSFNGVTPQLFSASDGVDLGANAGKKYTQEYTIPADFEYDYLEITPIYYYVKDNKTGPSGAAVADNFVQFYIENYDKALEATGWGHTLSVYPYYQYGSNWVENKMNAFGGYPGQPVIYYGGRRFIEIPTHYYTFPKDNNNATAQNCTIKGVTLSNDYWDVVHKEYVGAVSEHKQTYDFDDFVKIYRETTDNQEKNGKEGLADQITFQFKYRTATNNFSDSTVTSTDKNTGSTAAGNSSVPQPYASFTAAEKTSKFGNGWEPLLDYLDRPVDLFGKQLTDAQKALDPILVVSDDYEVTYAGSYATTWTVYARADASSDYTKIAEIAPSALIVTSKTRLDNTTLYPVTADRGGLDPTTLQEFGAAYNTLLAYKERPVEITYEEEIENNSSYKKYFDKSGVVTNGWKSEVAERSDGRWTYSYYNDDVQANIRIEYKNLESDPDWTVDAFKGDSNQGTVTGGKAYFTNTDTNKAGESFTNKTATGIVVSDQNKYYEFEATPAPGYIFAGWWFERDNIVTDVNADHSKLDGKSGMTSNATFVARYIKNPEGTLTIDHSVADGSIGSARTYIAVKAINKSTNAETWLTGAKTEADHFTEDIFEISSTYVGYKKDYKFEVTLKTVADQYTDFVRFNAKANDYENGEYSENYLSADKMTSGDTTTTTLFVIDNDDMYSVVDGFPVQAFDELTYYSLLDVKDFDYQLTYTYPAYLFEKYGDQAYVVRGTYNYDTLKDYMTVSSGTLSFTDDNKKINFINRYAPYEDNFMQTLSWNASAATTNFNSSTHTLEVAILTNESGLTIDDLKAKKLSLQFKFPYAHNTVANQYAATDTAYLTEPIAENVPVDYQPGYLSLFKPGNNFVTAPETLTLTDGGTTTTMVFRYWKVTAEASNAKSTDVEYTRCYETQFNLALFQNSIVEPVYTARAKVENTDNEDTSDRYDPAGQQNDDATDLGVTISFIENSRNQYNESHSGTGMTGSRATQGDRMYTDFLLNYNNAARDENNNVINLKRLDPNVMRTGLLIEEVGSIDIEDGRYVTKSETQYRDEYGTTLTEISNKLSYTDPSTNQPVTVDREAELKTFITSSKNAEVRSNDKKYTKVEFDAKTVDNKNRIQYYYSFANRSHSDLSQVYDYRYKVYRAYAYIVKKLDNSGTNDWAYTSDNTDIVISQTPVYFTIYDMASIQSAAEAEQSGGLQ